jgi:formiminotetrahydrofolate cyclodeaminase
MTVSSRGDDPPNPPAPPDGGNTASAGDRTVGELLDAVAARAPAPAAGAGAAIAVAVAAALAAKAARFSTGQLSELAADADRLRAEAVPLADADGEAYGAVLAATRLPREHPGRTEQLAVALAAATEIPLRIARIGSEVATLAGRLEDEGNPNLRGDAQAAALLADGAGQAAMALVRINRELASGAL